MLHQITWRHFIAKNGTFVEAIIVWIWMGHKSTGPQVYIETHHCRLDINKSSCVNPKGKHRLPIHGWLGLASDTPPLWTTQHGMSHKQHCNILCCLTNVQMLYINVDRFESYITDWFSTLCSQRVKCAMAAVSLIKRLCTFIYWLNEFIF